MYPLTEQSAIAYIKEIYSLVTVGKFSSTASTQVREDFISWAKQIGGVGSADQYYMFRSMSTADRQEYLRIEQQYGKSYAINNYLLAKNPAPIALARKVFQTLIDAGVRLKSKYVYDTAVATYGQDYIHSTIFNTTNLPSHCAALEFVSQADMVDTLVPFVTTLFWAEINVTKMAANTTSLARTLVALQALPAARLNFLSGIGESLYNTNSRELATSIVKVIPPGQIAELSNHFIATLKSDGLPAVVVNSLTPSQWMNLTPASKEWFSENTVISLSAGAIANWLTIAGKPSDTTLQLIDGSEIGKINVSDFVHFGEQTQRFFLVNRPTNLKMEVIAGEIAELFEAIPSWALKSYSRDKFGSLVSAIRDSEYNTTLDKTNNISKLIRSANTLDIGYVPADAFFYVDPTGISVEVMKNIGGAQLAQMQGSAWSRMTAVQISAIHPKAIQELRTSALANVAPENLKRLNVLAAYNITPQQFSALSDNQKSAIAVEFGTHLNASELNWVTASATQISNQKITASINGMDQANIADLRGDIFRRVDFIDILPSVIASMSGEQLAYVPAAQISSFSEEQTRAIRASVIPALGGLRDIDRGGNLLNLTISQLLWLNPEAVRNFKNKYFENLSNDKKEKLVAERAAYFGFDLLNQVGIIYLSKAQPSAISVAINSLAPAEVSLLRSELFQYVNINAIDNTVVGRLSTSQLNNIPSASWQTASEDKLASIGRANGNALVLNGVTDIVLRIGVISLSKMPPDVLAGMSNSQWQQITNAVKTAPANVLGSLGKNLFMGLRGADLLSAIPAASIGNLGSQLVANIDLKQFNSKLTTEQRVQLLSSTAAIYLQTPILNANYQSMSGVMIGKALEYQLSSATVPVTTIDLNVYIAADRSMLTAGSIKNIPDSVWKTNGKAFVSTFTEAQLAAIPSTAIVAMGNKFLLGPTIDLNSLSVEARNAITSDVVKAAVFSNSGNISLSAINVLGYVNLIKVQAALPILENKDLVKYIPIEVIQGLSSSAFSNFKFLSNLTRAQCLNLTLEQYIAIPASMRTSLAATPLYAVPEGDRAQVYSAQYLSGDLATLNATSMAMFSRDVLDHLSTSQLQSLSVEQLGCLAYVAIDQLNAGDFRRFTDRQLQAIESAFRPLINIGLIHDTAAAALRRVELERGIAVRLASSTNAMASTIDLQTAQAYGQSRLTAQQLGNLAALVQQSGGEPANAINRQFYTIATAFHFESLRKYFVFGGTVYNEPYRSLNEQTVSAISSRINPVALLDLGKFLRTVSTPQTVNDIVALTHVSGTYPEDIEGLLQCIQWAFSTAQVPIPYLVEILKHLFSNGVSATERDFGLLGAKDALLALLRGDLNWLRETLNTADKVRQQFGVTVDVQRVFNSWNVVGKGLLANAIPLGSDLSALAVGVVQLMKLIPEARNMEPLQLAGEVVKVTGQLVGATLFTAADAMPVLLKLKPVLADLEMHAIPNIVAGGQDQIASILSNKLFAQSVGLGLGGLAAMVGSYQVGKFMVDLSTYLKDPTIDNSNRLWGDVVNAGMTLGSSIVLNGTQLGNPYAIAFMLGYALLPTAEQVIAVMKSYDAVNELLNEGRFVEATYIAEPLRKGLLQQMVPGYSWFIGASGNPMIEEVMKNMTRPRVYEALQQLYAYTSKSNPALGKQLQILFEQANAEIVANPSALLDGKAVSKVKAVIRVNGGLTAPAAWYYRTDETSLPYATVDTFRSSTRLDPSVVEVTNGSIDLAKFSLDSAAPSSTEAVDIYYLDASVEFNSSSATYRVNLAQAGNRSIVYLRTASVMVEGGSQKTFFYVTDEAYSVAKQFSITGGKSLSDEVHIVGGKFSNIDLDKISNADVYGDAGPLIVTGSLNMRNFSSVVDGNTINLAGGAASLFLASSSNTVNVGGGNNVVNIRLSSNQAVGANVVNGYRNAVTSADNNNVISFSTSTEGLRVNLSGKNGSAQIQSTLSTASKDQAKATLFNNFSEIRGSNYGDSFDITGATVAGQEVTIDLGKGLSMVNMSDSSKAIIRNMADANAQVKLSGSAVGAVDFATGFNTISLTGEAGLVGRFSGGSNIVSTDSKATGIRDKIELTLSGGVTTLNLSNTDTMLVLESGSQGELHVNDAAPPPVNSSRTAVIEFDILALTAHANEWQFSTDAIGMVFRHIGADGKVDFSGGYSPDKIASNGAQFKSWKDIVTDIAGSNSGFKFHDLDGSIYGKDYFMTDIAREFLGVVANSVSPAASEMVQGGKNWWNFAQLNSQKDYVLPQGTVSGH